MKKIILIMLIGFGAYQTYLSRDDVSRVAVESHNEVIMYSLTTCGYCKQKGKELHTEGIKFKEYYIDTDSNKLKELNEKLSRAGYKPRSYGTPIMDVHGVMLPNNPPLNKIKKHL
jgi:glutaredoxin